MTTHYKRPQLKVPFRMRICRLGRVACMAVLFALIPFLLEHQMRDPAAYRFTGLVETESETVGPITTSRILAVEVLPGQHVKTGDVLVRLEASDHAVDMAMNAVRLNDYEQRVMRCEQHVADYRQDLKQEERRCRLTVQDATVALETEKMNRMRDEAELTGLKAEIARLQPLVDQRLVYETQLSSLRPKAQALEQTLARYGPLIDALQRQKTQAEADLAEIRKTQAVCGAALSISTQALTAPIHQAEVSVKRAVDNDPSVLRASRTGIVSRIFRQPGDVVVAGEPVIRIASSDAIYITGLLTQRHVSELSLNDKLRIKRTVAGDSPPLTAQVELIEPEVMDLLDPFNPAPRFPVRGRRVRLRILEANNTLVPGEAVTLEVMRRATWLDGVKRICFLAKKKAAAF